MDDSPLPGVKEQLPADRLLNRRVHMANERTFLAWIRTSIGIMAFGFVIERFALFTRQMALIMGKQNIDPQALPQPLWSSVIGILVVALGALISGLAFLRYKKVKKQIDDDSFHHSSTINAWLTVAVLGIGILLVIYLVFIH
ncbi:MAG TPA: DUF202 domain-containing protein [Prolixibacteraceae bacterium]|nr:DUF202 domain-containing protein [Prolixibacteraceae bacterium]